MAEPMKRVVAGVGGGDDVACDEVGATVVAVVDVLVDGLDAVVDVSVDVLVGMLDDVTVAVGVLLVTTGDVVVTAGEVVGVMMAFRSMHEN